MSQRLDRITDRQWKRAVNEMLASYAPKTVKVSVGMVKTVVTANDVKFPAVTIGKASAQKAKEMDKVSFLEPEQIPAFVAAAKESPYCIPLLLALSSLRIAEIDGLDWKDVTKDVVKVRRVRIKDKEGNWILKDGAKNETSVRDVPVLIPELKKALDAARQTEGKVMTCSQEGLRKGLRRISESAGLPNPGVHGLRHTFASLSAHLGIPEIVSQEIGGWANDKIMKEIYTHVARSDVSASLEKIKAFYANKIANNK
jgi:integrase